MPYASGLRAENFRRVAVIGEMNPYGADPDMALYPLPYGASGDRLRRIMGLSMADYIALTRLNLCVGKWSIVAARRTVAEWFRPNYDVIVMLGRKVALACASTLVAFETDGYLVALPHPSGRNLVWNAPDSVERARSVLEKVAPGVPWGSDEDAL